METAENIQDALKSEWTTFDGRLKTFGEMDQQHLSNIFWYYKYVVTAGFGEYLKNKIKMVLEHRFNGQLLSYRPHVSFKQEMKFLRESGMLKVDGSITESRTSDKIIGRIITIE